MSVEEDTAPLGDHPLPSHGVTRPIDVASHSL